MKWARISILGGLALLGGLWLLDRHFPPPMARFENAAREVTARDGRILSVWPAPGGVWRLRTTAADVPPHLLALLIAAEDRRFHQHPGVDPLALARAAAQWLRAGRVVSGGSTLSMQAARLLEPRPRNLRSKLIEIARAFQLEWRHGKQGVLEIWLTLAPQGGNLEGLRAGSLAWFGRPVSSLDASEAALLIALARRPEALRPDRHPQAARLARDAVLIARAPDIASGAEIALAGAVPERRLAMPRHAPHAPDAPHAAREGRTTLDLDLQRGIEAVARDALARLPERVSLAIMVTDLRSRETRALVGGDWMNPARAGALDLTRAVRSPGSTLKPLIYALAFESGIAQPETLMEDLPRRFGDYAPENFDRAFQGRLRVADALRQSLNQPAVALLNEIGPLRLASVMKAAGAIPRLPPGAEPSLPLALGGVGVTLREMMGLYAMLGDGGAGAVERRAANLASAILVQPLPGGGAPGIAWKTGTSWGGRDAWAMGMDQRHVVGIWVGRPDGTPMPNATGARLALPLLAQVFERLPAAPRAGLPPRPLSAGVSPPTDGLRLLFPPPRATLPEAGRVVLRAAGGQRPLTFLVDGAPLVTDPARREVSWVPPGPGFYRITVLDAEGAATRTELRVR